MTIRRPWGACWMVAEGGEGENPFLSARGGWGGVGGVSRLRFPPGPHLRSSRFSRHPRLRQAPIRRFAEKIVVCEVWVVFVGKRPQAPGGPGPKPWGPGPQAPWRPGPQAPGAWILVNPQSADLGGRWMVSEGGAVQFHERRGSRLRSSISAAGPGPKPLQTWPTSPCPVKNSKNARVLIGS